MTLTFRSDGELVPAGEYLVDLDDRTLAWREDPSFVWCLGIDAEPISPRDPRIADHVKDIGRGHR